MQDRKLRTRKGLLRVDPKNLSSSGNSILIDNLVRSGHSRQKLRCHLVKSMISVGDEVHDLLHALLCCRGISEAFPDYSCFEIHGNSDVRILAQNCVDIFQCLGILPMLKIMHSLFQTSFELVRNDETRFPFSKGQLHCTCLAPEIP